MLSGVAELLEMDPELLDDVKTAVSEACNNVVLHAYGDGSGPMEVRVYAGADEICVIVADRGGGFVGVPDPTDPRQGIGVSVIRALTRDASFAARPGGGAEVAMHFDARREGRSLFAAPRPAAPDIAFAPGDEDDLGLTLSPISLLTGVLGRLARTLAATAHFSLDRFSDVYLVTDTLAAHAAASATSDRVVARLRAGERRLEVVLGPFVPGSGAGLADRGADRMSSPLTALADEVAVIDGDGSEAIRVVVVDHRR
jgi:hypothetical protein